MFLGRNRSVFCSVGVKCESFCLKDWLPTCNEMLQVSRYEETVLNAIRQLEEKIVEEEEAGFEAQSKSAPKSKQGWMGWVKSKISST